MHRFPVVLALSLIGAGVYAQTQTARPPEPKVGQPGKDVVWVPTPDVLVEKMLDLATVTPQDYVIDLGSGDGRTVIAAAKRGARAHGIEYNRDLVILSRQAAAAAGVAARATFAEADLYATDFSAATVLTMFLLPEINMNLRPKILALRPGTRVVSNTFSMQDWEPEETVTVTGCQVYCTAHFWIVPARVEGAWQSPEGTFSLSQLFQNVRGTLATSTGPAPILNGRLRGDQIVINVAGVRYSGRVDGNTIQGTYRSQDSMGAWRASRIGR